MPKRSTRPKPITLPDDVLDILRGVIPGKSVEDAICHLARSYDAIMEEQGQTSEHVQMPSPGDGEAENSINPSELPSMEDIEHAASALTEPEQSRSVKVREHVRTTPRDSDGLVPTNYILASGVPVVEDFLSNKKYSKTEDHRLQAIREILSKTPEDVWNGANVPSQVDQRYNELVGKRKNI